MEVVTRRRLTRKQVNNREEEKRQEKNPTEAEEEVEGQNDEDPGDNNRYIVYQKSQDVQKNTDSQGRQRLEEHSRQIMRMQLGPRRRRNTL